MTFTTFTSLSGIPLRSSNRLRTVVIPVLGVMLGSAFKPDTLDKVNLWIPSLSIMVLYVIFISATVGFFFYKFVKVDLVTAFFSATPGGLATMVILGSDHGGNEKIIALTHSIRILLTVLIIPFWFQFFEGYQIGGQQVIIHLNEMYMSDTLILLLSGIIGFYGGKIIKLPSYQLLGPMLLSAMVHLLGLTTASLPTIIINIAQIIIGSGIGSRFSGVSIKQVSRTLISAIISTIYILSLAALASSILTVSTGIPFKTLLLSFAPGGLAEMTLISFSMGIDPAFVSTHHLLRVSIMVIMAPIIFNFLKKNLSFYTKTKGPNIN